MTSPSRLTKIKRAAIKSAAIREVDRRLRDRLPDLAPNLMQFGQYWPHDYKAESFARPLGPDTSTTVDCSPFPVPPREFWAHYSTSAEKYLASGQEDCDTMRRLLSEGGAPAEKAGRILEVGCAGGRMIRCLADLAPENELWGTDLWSSAIMWCQDHLSPPCHFVTNTIAPHLPFADRSMGLIFCGSVFTHIDDLAESWFLELHRILEPGGRLYFSVNDRHAVNVFDGNADPAAYDRYYERTGGRENWEAFVDMIAREPDYRRFRRGDAYMVTMGRSMSAHVLWDSDVLCRRLEYGYRKCSINPESYGHQTVIVLERI